MAARQAILHDITGGAPSNEVTARYATMTSAPMRAYGAGGIPEAPEHELAVRGRLSKILDITIRKVHQPDERNPSILSILFPAEVVDQIPSTVVVRRIADNAGTAMQVGYHQFGNQPTYHMAEIAQSGSRYGTMLTFSLEMRRDNPELLYQHIARQAANCARMMRSAVFMNIIWRMSALQSIRELKYYKMIREQARGHVVPLSAISAGEQVAGAMHDAGRFFKVLQTTIDDMRSTENVEPNVLVLPHGFLSSVRSSLGVDERELQRASYVNLNRDLVPQTAEKIRASFSKQFGLAIIELQPCGQGAFENNVLYNPGDNMETIHNFMTKTFLPLTADDIAHTWKAFAKETHTRVRATTNEPRIQMPDWIQGTWRTLYYFDMLAAIQNDLGIRDAAGGGGGGFGAATLFGDDDGGGGDNTRPSLMPVQLNGGSGGTRGRSYRPPEDAANNDMSVTGYLRARGMHEEGNARAAPSLFSYLLWVMGKLRVQKSMYPQYDARNDDILFELGKYYVEAKEALQWCAGGGAGSSATHSFDTYDPVPPPVLPTGPPVVPTAPPEIIERLNAILNELRGKIALLERGLHQGVSKEEISQYASSLDAAIGDAQGTLDTFAPNEREQLADGIELAKQAYDRYREHAEEEDNDGGGAGGQLTEGQDRELQDILDKLATATERLQHEQNQDNFVALENIYDAAVRWENKNQTNDADLRRSLDQAYETLKRFENVVNPQQRQLSEDEKAAANAAEFLEILQNDIQNTETTLEDALLKEFNEATEDFDKAESAAKEAAEKKLERVNDALHLLAYHNAFNTVSREKSNYPAEFKHAIGTANNLRLGWPKGFLDEMVIYAKNNKLNASTYSLPYDLESKTEDNGNREVLAFRKNDGIYGTFMDNKDFYRERWLKGQVLDLARFFTTRGSGYKSENSVLLRVLTLLHERGRFLADRQESAATTASHVTIAHAESAEVKNAIAFARDLAKHLKSAIAKDQALSFKDAEASMIKETKAAINKYKGAEKKKMAALLAPVGALVFQSVPSGKEVSRATIAAVAARAENNEKLTVVLNIGKYPSPKDAASTAYASFDNFAPFSAPVATAAVMQPRRRVPPPRRSPPRRRAPPKRSTSWRRMFLNTTSARGDGPASSRPEPIYPEPEHPTHYGGSSGLHTVIDRFDQFAQRLMRRGSSDDGGAVPARLEDIDKEFKAVLASMPNCRGAFFMSLASLKKTFDVCGLLPPFQFSLFRLTSDISASGVLAHTSPNEQFATLFMSNLNAFQAVTGKDYSAVATDARINPVIFRPNHGVVLSNLAILNLNAGGQVRLVENGYDEFLTNMGRCNDGSLINPVEQSTAERHSWNNVFPYPLLLGENASTPRDNITGYPHLVEFEHSIHELPVRAFAPTLYLRAGRRADNVLNQPYFEGITFGIGASDAQAALRFNFNLSDRGRTVMPVAFVTTQRLIMNGATTTPCEGHSKLGAYAGPRVYIDHFNTTSFNLTEPAGPVQRISIAH